MEDILQRNQYIYLPPPMSNPLDYEFFVNVIRSEDEAAQALEWQKLKTKLTSSPVTPTIQLKDLNNDNLKEVDLQMYLAPDHMESMFAKLSPAELSYLVISGKISSKSVILKIFPRFHAIFFSIFERYFEQVNSSKVMCKHN